MPQHQSYVAVKPRQKDKILVADIGSGHWSPHFDNAVVKRFDMNPDTKPDIVCDVRAIPEKPEMYDFIYSSHVLEHFFYYEVKDVFAEWLRILKVGGEFKILVPNLEHAAHEILKSCNNENYDSSYAFGGIYGTRPQGADRDSSWSMRADSPESTQIHKMGFTKPGLRRFLEMFKCLDDIKVEPGGFDGNASLTATGKKVKSSKPEIILDTWNETVAPREKVMLNTKDLGSHPIEEDDNVQHNNAAQTRKKKVRTVNKLSPKPKAK